MLAHLQGHRCEVSVRDDRGVYSGTVGSNLPLIFTWDKAIIPYHGAIPPNLEISGMDLWGLHERRNFHVILFKHRVYCFLCMNNT